MRHLTSKEYAEDNNIPLRHVQMMYKQGDIKDDRKKGRRRMIPIKDKNIPPLPIRLSDYKSASDNYYYVDKTLMIKDILDERPMVSPFTRPRGFGKSLNMNMLRVFFEISDENTSVYFRNKKIWKCGDYYTKHQGKYPVVFLTLKDVKCDDWESSFHLIHRIISEEFERHSELLNSSVISSYDKDYINKILDGNASECDLEFSLLSLSRLLSLHYDVKPIIIVDEYDTPSEHSFVFGYYDKMGQVSW